MGLPDTLWLEKFKGYGTLGIPCSDLLLAKRPLKESLPGGCQPVSDRVPVIPWIRQQVKAFMEYIGPNIKGGE